MSAKRPARRDRKNPPKKPAPPARARSGLPAHLVPGNPGNSGGKKGRSGRPPLAWKAFCRDVVNDPATQDEVRAALEDRTTPGYAQLLKLLAGYAAGLPVQTVRIGGLLSTAQRVEGLSDADLERFLASPDGELLASLVTAAEEEEETQT